MKAVSDACTPDLTDERSVIQHFRDLHNVSDLLGDDGYQEEVRSFIKKLSDIGWGSDRIQQMLTYSGYGCRFEYMKDQEGGPLIPRPIPNSGSQREWRKLKTRTKR